MNIGPSPQIFPVPENYRIEKGKGFVIRDGKDLAIIAYGPVMLSEAYTASKILSENGVEAKIINMPWLNCVNPNWLTSEINSYKLVYVMDDHSTIGGLGDHIITKMHDLNVKIIKIGLNDFPSCGNPLEVLKAHQMDGRSIAKLVSRELDKSLDKIHNSESVDYIDNAPQ